MKRNYYIFSNTIIKRQCNTLVFETGDWKELDINEQEMLLSQGLKDKFDTKTNKKYIPINDIESLYIFGEVRFNSKFLNFLTKNNIPFHLFNYYGYYSGSFYPRDYLYSGKLLIKQVENCIDLNKRLYIAQEIIDSTCHNTLKNLKYYSDKNSNEINKKIKIIEKLRLKIKTSTTINELMAFEANIKKNYYDCWKFIIKPEINFKKRIKNPPDNMINTLISFGNMMCYSSCLTEIFHSQLNPTISYLHEPQDRRFSLSLDIAEIFKPIFVDRIIFKLLNNKILQEKDFTKELNFCLMNEKAKQKFVEEWDEKLKTTIFHKKLKKQVSYRRLIRLECYKLIKHLIEDEKYEGLKIYW